MFSEYCCFSYGDGDNDVIDYASGEWINFEGRGIDRDDLNLIASKIGKKTIDGGLIY
jgi:hypothetical protein